MEVNNIARNHFNLAIQAENYKKILMKRSKVYYCF